MTTEQKLQLILDFIDSFDGQIYWMRHHPDKIKEWLDK